MKLPLINKVNQAIRITCGTMQSALHAGMKYLGRVLECQENVFLYYRVAQE
jgi:hypothetical protein